MLQKKYVFACASGLALTMASTGALAQAQTLPGLAAAADSNAVSELVVTAQKRTERLQDVPVVVTVLTGAKLEANNVRSVADLVTLTPGFTSTTNASEGTTIARIRGVGNVADNPGLEDAVGLYIDGIYRPRNGVSFNDLGELSDIEILKGPQGTLFGKNTIAGVIQITTKRPSFTYSAQAEATVQNFNGYGGSVSLTGPVVADKVAIRLYVADRERDGYIPVVQAPTTHIPDQNDEHVFTTRDQLLVNFTDDLDVNFIADYARRRDHCCVAVDYQNGSPAVVQNEVFPGTVPNPVSSQNNTAFLNRSTVDDITDQGISAEAHWKTPWLANATLTSITAYRDSKENTGGDTDGTLADIINSDPATNFTRFRQFSEELQYRGSTPRLNWQVGFFYSHELLDNGVFLQNGPALGPYLNVLSGGVLPANGFPTGQGAIDTYHQREHSEAIYTQEEFKLTDQLSLIGGLRYTWEHKDLESLHTNNDTANTCANLLQGATHSPTPIPFSAFGNFSKAIFGTACLVNPAFNGSDTHQSLDEGALTGTAKLQYKFSDEAMVYGSYSRGNLVGGFNLAEVTLPFGPGGAPNTSLAPQTDTSFPAENVNAYELGAKTQWLDRRLSLNAALFFQSYRDHQLNAFTGTQFVEFTIPEAQTGGVELEGVFAVTPDLSLNGGVTYAETTYPDDAKNKAVLQAPGSELFLLPGSRLSYAPLWSLTLGGSYKHQVTEGWDGFVNVDAKYSSSYQIGSDEDPNKSQPGFGLVNGSIGVKTHDNRLEFSIWGTNLLNQFYKQTAFDGVLQTFSTPPAANPGQNNYYAFPGEPRFYGATVKVRFE
ncbi:TonB-dependent receptor [Phenylobacterium sp.]|jgi:outer membrane receptor protein involved in Fe transport|uniref:TonB-dependent receptor n=1 Tax=Phenylobacterium sp. TaxID=1871053 RepID=UPI002E341660|nr:TonB-dependent receptor [Phenylobacterium sp.]HEX3363651.1 TonB-dependent receptor [Phenylobacterium sp.]